MKRCQIITLVFLSLVILPPITAKADLKEVCLKIDCTTFLEAFPKIKGKLGLLTSGGEILVLGSGFGTSKGKLFLKFPIENQEKEVWQIAQLTLTYIYATIHGGITGVRDQTAKLQVVTASNLKSN